VDRARRRSLSYSRASMRDCSCSTWSETVDRMEADDSGRIGRGEAGTERDEEGEVKEAILSCKALPLWLSSAVDRGSSRLVVEGDGGGGIATPLGMRPFNVPTDGAPEVVRGLGVAKGDVPGVESAELKRPFRVGEGWGLAGVVV
jgi:hypothetical protein